MKAKRPNRYQALLSHVFFKYWHETAKIVSFERPDLEEAASELGMKVPKNLGDVLYSFRYRNPLPDEILETQPPDMHWIIEGAGRALYEFRLVPINRIAPNPNLITIKIPDATPEIVSASALSDEQALLARVRYNRLIDIFLGITAYSLQNHLRTTVKLLGQVEIDEVYVGVDRFGCQYIVPVQAKGGNDQLSTVQAKQDIACCAEKFPNLVCRALSAQFMEESKIALFELCLENDGIVRVVDEKHYRLVPSAEIGTDELASYRKAGRR